MISDADGKILLTTVRKTIQLAAQDKIFKAEDEFQRQFSKKQGVFVTLYKKGNLRGCIGYPEPVYPLHKAIINAAIAAATEDPRFSPISEDELDSITIDISILTVPEQIHVNNPEEYIKKINIGKDGLIIRSNLRSGLLLPQVASEYGWDAKEFLENVSQKAGLASNAWKDKNNSIFKFQAQIFSE